MITVNIEGKLLRWYDDVGAMVEQGDVIAEIQTADGNVSVLAPQSGRLTEMMALAGDTVQAGQTIGWIDEVGEPQSLGALIDPPAERKLKPKEQKRKPRPALPSSTLRWALFGLMALFGVSGLMVLMFGPVSMEDTRIVTSVPDMPMPTPRFRIRERVLLNAQVGDHIWGEQGVVQASGFEMGSGTWYDVQFGDDLLTHLPESQLEDLGSLAPTPTMQFNSVIGNADYSLMLKEPVADFPAGTRVTIGSAMFNGVEYELHVTTENGVGLNVRESQLEIAPETPAP